MTETPMKLLKKVQNIPKPEYYQNTPKTFKMTEIPPKAKNLPKYS